jgi:hypothetical protein
MDDEQVIGKALDDAIARVAEKFRSGETEAPEGGWFPRFILDALDQQGYRLVSNKDWFDQWDEGFWAGKGGN